jgi:hypothetical protein
MSTNRTGYLPRPHSTRLFLDKCGNYYVFRGGLRIVFRTRNVSEIGIGCVTKSFSGALTFVVAWPQMID